MSEIPYNKIIKRKGGGGGNSKIKCDNCGVIKRIKFMALFKGKVLCSNCRPHLIGVQKSWKKQTK